MNPADSELSFCLHTASHLDREPSGMRLAGEVIAQAVDDQQGHPLRHVVMRAVAAAAERDLRLWPSAVPADGEPPSSLHEHEAGETPDLHTSR